jgi:integrase
MSKQPPRKPVKMTDLWVQKYRKPGLSPSDTESGMRLYVGASGRKSWVRFYRHPISKKLVKKTMPFMSLAQARKCVADDNFLLSQNIDPIEDERAKKQAKLDAVEGTLNAVAKQYLSIAASKLRSHNHYESVLKRHILPRLGERRVTELKRSEIAAVLDKVEIDSGSSASDMALAVLSVTLHWYEGRSDVFRSPIIKGMRRVKPSESARERKLSDDEIKRAWDAAGDDRLGVYGQIVKFLILTGSRRSEAAGLKRSEIGIDDETGLTVWRLPASRSKNKREIMRPLSAAALDIVNAMPIISDSDYVFTLDGIRPMSMNHQRMKDLFASIAGVDDMRIHDLRRVHRSLLSRCRTPFEIAEMLLGHSRPTLVRTYDQHHPLVEMQEAVEKVAAEIARIVEGERGGKVIRLRS